jgi:competence protein ComEC
LQFRKYADNLIKRILPQPHAGIISAMTLGIKSNISEEVLANFNKTGTRHIIAISGLHMTIVAVVLMFLLLAIGLKRNYAFYFAILGIIFFVALVGFPPSAVRAAVMGGMVLFAVKVGRLSSSGNAIVFAGVLMLLYNPNLLRYDTGFQLSFSAILGIIYIFSRLDKIFEKYPDHLNIKSMLLITISAQLATLPIIINSFGSFSLLSVFANVLILPFVPAVMLGGFLIIIISSANLFLAQIISYPIWLILTYQIEIIKFFAGFDFGYFSFEKTGWLFIAVYYGVLVLGARYVKIKNNI